MAGRLAAAAIGLVVLAALLSGCSGSAKPAAPGPDAHSAKVADEGGEVGAIRGYILDDEEVGIAGAQVGLRGLDAILATSEDGAFEFTGVPAGRQEVLATALGYVSAAVFVDVVADETAEIALVLQGLPIVRAFIERFPHSAVHHYGEVYLDYALWTAGVDGGCTTCEWNITTKANPRHLLIEIQGRHAVANPATGDAEYLYAFSDGTLNIRENYVLPARVVMTGAHANATKEFSFAVLCDYYWFCIEEKRDIWVSAFHEMDIPEGYSAFVTP